MRANARSDAPEDLPTPFASFGMNREALTKLVAAARRKRRRPRSFERGRRLHIFFSL